MGKKSDFISEIPVTMAGISALTMSSDDIHVYVVSSLDHTLVVFRRNFNNDTLTFFKKYTNEVDGLEGVKLIELNP